MRVRSFAVAVAVLGALACEQGWEIEGEVLTDGIGMRDRALLVLVFTDPDVGADGLPRPGRRWGQVAASEASIPDQRLRYSYLKLGCVADSFQIVAWAPPRELPPMGFTSGRELDLRAGDFVAFTAPTRITSCGYRGTQRVESM
jgi:hypothetical protein